MKFEIGDEVLFKACHSTEIIIKIKDDKILGRYTCDNKMSGVFAPMCDYKMIKKNKELSSADEIKYIIEDIARRNK